jgi:chromate transport protein ChrA
MAEFLQQLLTAFAAFGLPGLIIGTLFILLGGIIYWILNSTLKESRKQTEQLILLNGGNKQIKEDIKSIKKDIRENSLCLVKIDLRTKECLKTID